MKVLGIGETVLDSSYIMSSFIKEGTKCDPLILEKSVGGPVAAALIVLARLGVDCTLMTRLGNDVSGNFIADFLKKENISLIKSPQLHTKENTVLVNKESGSRTIIKGVDTNTKITVIDPQVLAEIDLIILDRHEPEILDQLLKYKKPKTKIIIDPSNELSENTLKLIEFADYPIIPIELIEKLHPETVLDGIEFLGRNCKKLIVTLGAGGSLIYTKGALDYVPSYEINVTDTLGAGDVFRGAFAYGVLMRWSDLKCLKFANKVAALQCTRYGNGTAIPTKTEMLTSTLVQSERVLKL